MGSEFSPWRVTGSRQRSRNGSTSSSTVSCGADRRRSTRQKACHALSRARRRARSMLAPSASSLYSCRASAFAPAAALPWAPLVRLPLRRKSDRAPVHLLKQRTRAIIDPDFQMTVAFPSFLVVQRHLPPRNPCPPRLGESRSQNSANCTAGESDQQVRRHTRSLVRRADGGVALIGRRCLVSSEADSGNHP